MKTYNTQFRLAHARWRGGYDHAKAVPGWRGPRVSKRPFGRGRLLLRRHRRRVAGGLLQLQQGGGGGSGRVRLLSLVGGGGGGVDRHSDRHGEALLQPLTALHTHDSMQLCNTTAWFPPIRERIPNQSYRTNHSARAKARKHPSNYVQTLNVWPFSIQYMEMHTL